MFDPYLKDLPRGAESPEVRAHRVKACRRQKCILVTHGHFDHIHDLPLLYGDRDCTVYLTGTPQKTLLREKFPAAKMRLIHPGDVLWFGKTKVTVYQGSHVRFDRKVILKTLRQCLHPRMLPRAIRLGIQDLRYPENGESLFFEIESEGKRVQLMGSARIREDVPYPTHADALILPHQGRSDIDRTNLQIVKRLRPRRVLLDHYDDAFPPISSLISTDRFCRALSRTLSAEKLVEGRSVNL